MEPGNGKRVHNSKMSLVLSATLIVLNFCYYC